MSDFPSEAEGGCMCGAVRYKVTGQPLSTIYCHCTSCKKHTGAPVVALAGYRRDQVFCGDCGTPMTWEGDGGEEGPLVEFLISTLDNPEDFAPQCHIHDQERYSWFETHDQLPRYRVWHDGDDEPVRYGPEET